MWFAALGNYQQNPWFANFCDAVAARLAGGSGVAGEKSVSRTIRRATSAPNFTIIISPTLPNAARPARGGNANSSANTCRRFHFLNRIGRKFMSDITENRAFNWFTPSRFGILLAAADFRRVSAGPARTANIRRARLRIFCLSARPFSAANVSGTANCRFGTLTTIAACRSWRNGTPCRFIRRR